MGYIDRLQRMWVLLRCCREPTSRVIATTSRNLLGRMRMTAEEQLDNLPNPNSNIYLRVHKINLPRNLGTKRPTIRYCPIVRDLQGLIHIWLPEQEKSVPLTLMILWDDDDNHEDRPWDERKPVLIMSENRDTDADTHPPLKSLSSMKFFLFKLYPNCRCEMRQLIFSIGTLSLSFYPCGASSLIAGQVTCQSPSCDYWVMYYTPYEFISREPYFLVTFSITSIPEQWWSC